MNDDDVIVFPARQRWILWASFALDLLRRLLLPVCLIRGHDRVDAMNLDMGIFDSFCLRCRKVWKD